MPPYTALLMGSSSCTVILYQRPTASASAKCLCRGQATARLRCAPAAVDASLLAAPSSSHARPLFMTQPWARGLDACAVAARQECLLLWMYISRGTGRMPPPHRRACPACGDRSMCEQARVGQQGQACMLAAHAHACMASVCTAAAGWRPACVAYGERCAWHRCCSTWLYCGRACGGQCTR